MSYDDNPYYKPEQYGLTKIGEVDLTEPFYSFDILAAWKDENGIYLGTDSGCSCPVPFENYRGKDDMTGPLTVEQALEEASSLKGESTYELDEFNDFLAAIRSA